MTCLSGWVDAPQPGNAFCVKGYLVNDIEFVQLAEIDEEKIISLMNNEQVGAQLPLLAGFFY